MPECSRKIEGIERAESRKRGGEKLKEAKWEAGARHLRLQQP